MNQCRPFYSGMAVVFATDPGHTKQRVPVPREHKHCQYSLRVLKNFVQSPGKIFARFTMVSPWISCDAVG